jgi:hypothetical protein
MDVLFLEKRLDIDYLLTFEFDQRIRRRPQTQRNRHTRERSELKTQKTLVILGSLTSACLSVYLLVSLSQTTSRNLLWKNNHK